MGNFKEELQKTVLPLIEQDRDKVFKNLRLKLNLSTEINLETFVEDRLEEIYPKVGEMSNYVEQTFHLKKEDYNLFGEFLYLLQIDIFIKNPTVVSFYALNFNRIPQVLTSKLECRIDSTFLNTRLYTVYRAQKASKVKLSYKASYNKKSN